MYSKAHGFFLIFYRKLALHIETVFFATFLCVLYISGGDNAFQLEKSLSVQSSPGHISLHIQEICLFFLYIESCVYKTQKHNQSTLCAIIVIQHPLDCSPSTCTLDLFTSHHIIRGFCYIRFVVLVISRLLVVLFCGL